MLSRIIGQTEKASQEQVSDKAAAAVSALAKLVHSVSTDSGVQVQLQTVLSGLNVHPHVHSTVDLHLQVISQASHNLAVSSDHIAHTEQVPMMQDRFCARENHFLLS